VGFVALGLISGPATAIPAPLSVIEGEAPRRRPGGFGLGVAAVLIAWVIVFAQAIPLLAQREVDKSRAASARGNVRDALDAAESARDIQPWAATPYLQLALVSEQIGALPLARVWIRKAIARDREDWRFWLVAARLETKLGRVAAAERSLDRAVELNPRSPLFKGLVGDSAGG
jgi:tetratricopeptide (TPR) repeat protein